jgi:hypothetical protein
MTDVSTRTDARARQIGLAIGLLLALAAVLSWRIAGGGAGLGAEVSFVAAPPGELTVEPVDSFLSANGLQAGESAHGRLLLRNITGGLVSVRLRAEPSSRDLDRGLRIGLASGGRSVYRGSLGALRRWTPAGAVPRGGQRALEARIWVAKGAAVAGAVVDVTVELEARRG